jgi:hypothetical protein
MKKWVDRKWEDLRAGDRMRYATSTHNGVPIEHIGQRFLLTEVGVLIDRYLLGKERGFQRLEEVEPPAAAEIERLKRVIENAAKSIYQPSELTAILVSEIESWEEE